MIESSQTASDSKLVNIGAMLLSLMILTTAVGVGYCIFRKKFRSVPSPNAEKDPNAVENGENFAISPAAAETALRFRDSPPHLVDPNSALKLNPRGAMRPPGFD